MIKEDTFQFENKMENTSLTLEPRGGDGRDRGRGQGGGRNPWGNRKTPTAVQAFTGSAGVVKYGSNMV